MIIDPYFGLPPLVVSAIRDSDRLRPSQKCQPTAAARSARRGVNWRSAVKAVAAAVAMMASSHAAHAQDGRQNLVGRWSMVATESFFDEAVTGPAPQSVQWVVTRDDPFTFVYQLRESKGRSLLSRGDYAARWATGRVAATVDGRRGNLSAERFGDDRREFKARPVGGWQGAIRIHPISVDRVVIDHVIVGPAEERVIEHIIFQREEPALAALAPASPGAAAGAF
jgi:hypothetical protein